MRPERDLGQLVIVDRPGKRLGRGHIAKAIASIVIGAAEATWIAGAATRARLTNIRVRFMVTSLQQVNCPEGKLSSRTAIRRL
jgi:hypothetical protein